MPGCPKEHLVNNSATNQPDLDTGNSLLVCNTKKLPIYFYMYAQGSVDARQETIYL